MNREEQLKASVRRESIRVARAIRALLQKGMSPKEVSKLLEIPESNLITWVQIADDKW